MGVLKKKKRDFVKAAESRAVRLRDRPLRELPPAVIRFSTTRRLESLRGA